MYKQRIISLSVLAVFFLLIGNFSLNAQDGKKLFEANCGACHKPDKDMIGPGLKGKKQAWIDAGEGDMLYDWVHDAMGLVDSGTSEMAKIAVEFAPSSMSVQTVSNEEIDQIFDYVEAFVPKVVEVDAFVEEVDYYKLDKEGHVVEGWTPKTNRMFFWLQVILMLILIFAIFTMSKSIQAVVKYRENNKSNNGLVKFIAIPLAIGFMSISNEASAFEIGMDQGHFVDVTFGDNIIFLVVNLILVAIFFYMRSVLNNILGTYYPELEDAKQKLAAKKLAGASATNVLTHAVPIEEERSILLDHDYDGIQELDNHLPPWWVWSFYASIIFAFYYLIVHHVTNTSPDQTTEYVMSMEDAQNDIDAYIASIGGIVDESTAKLLTADAELYEGSLIFAENCATCHMGLGQGETGPNLTDDYWIYGNNIMSVFTIVKYGQTVKGMPSHERILSADQIEKVSSFVLSLPFEKGKAPQGGFIEDVPVIEEVIEEVVPEDLTLDEGTSDDVAIIESEEVAE